MQTITPQHFVLLFAGGILVGAILTRLLDWVWSRAARNKRSN